MGADGIGSAVRKLIYPDVAPAYRSFCAWRTVMRCADGDPVFRLSTTTGCFLGSFPVGPDLVYAFLLASYAGIPALSREQHLARFKELAAQFHGNVSPLIQQQQEPAQVIFVPVMEVQTPSYYQGRMVLIGDAAHAFSPLLAQGAAMAIEDAVALAELLGDSGGIDQALRSYESRRWPRVETIRAAVRHRSIARGMEGPATPELLKQHPQVFSTSLNVFTELIEDPFGRAPAVPIRHHFGEARATDNRSVLPRPERSQRMHTTALPARPARPPRHCRFRRYRRLPARSPPTGRPRCAIRAGLGWRKRIICGGHARRRA